MGVSPIISLHHYDTGEFIFERHKKQLPAELVNQATSQWVNARWVLGPELSLPAYSLKAGAAAHMPGIIREQKRHYNKPDQEFECERLYQDQNRVILRYVAHRSYSISGRAIAAGSSTLGLYEKGARHVFWKMLDPAGQLEAYLVHLCEPVEIDQDSVSYRDLMLDIWQEPPTPPLLLDEDELTAAVEAGLLTLEAGSETMEQARNLLSNFDSVVLEAEAKLKQYVPAYSPALIEDSATKRGEAPQ